MGRDKIEQQTPDLFSTEGVDSSQSTSWTVVRPPLRLVLPKDLPDSIKYLDDRELDRLLAAAIDEAKSRGRPLASLEPGPTGKAVGLDEPKPKRPRSRQIGLAPSALTQGKFNAVRAAFKAGITVARIARQFGLSHADVRKALSSEK